MNEEFLSVQDILRIVKRHILLILLTITFCEASAILLVKKLPKKFKSSAQLNLKSSYFEIPGIGEGLTYAEIQAQKQALLQLAVNQVFLDKEGEKYDLFTSKPGTAAREGEQEGLRKKIDFVSSSATTFRISALGRTAAIAYGLTTDSLDQIVSALASERNKTIMLHRDSLIKQLESMGITTHVDDSGAGSGERLKAELAREEARLSTLRGQFTSSHPAVVALERKVRDLKTEIEQHRERPAGMPGSAAKLTIDPNAKGPRTDFAEELLKKINYLDIALELENNKKDLLYLEILEHPVLPDSYIFPNPIAFALGGFMLGFLLAGVAVTLLEVRRAGVITPLMASTRLGIPLLGTLPTMVVPEGAETFGHTSQGKP